MDTYAWSFGDGGTSSDQNPVYTYYNSGSYTVQLIATKGTSADTLTRPAFILASNGAVYAGPDTTICSGNVYTVVDAYANGATSLLWTTTAIALR